jgi:hypothetical protein
LHLPRGSGLPLAVAVHFPGFAGSLQVWHAPAQSESQQTPSTQWLVAQSLSLLQAWPLTMSGVVQPFFPEVCSS